MYLLVWRKMVNNLWKVLCLLLGALMVMALASAVPIYTNGILQRMLIRDLETYQEQSSDYPGYLAIESNFRYIDSQDILATSSRLNQELQDMMAGMPQEAAMTQAISRVGGIYYQTENNGKTINSFFEIASLTAFPDQVSVVKGRLYQPRDDGVVEAVASAASLRYTGMVMDRVYEIYHLRQEDGELALLKIKIVGIYEPEDHGDAYWYDNMAADKTTLVVDGQQLQSLYLANDLLLPREQTLYTVYDYHAFNISGIDQLAGVYRQGQLFESDNLRTSKFYCTFGQVVTEYELREGELMIALQILIIPILLMLVMFIFMVSRLMARSDMTTVSVLESRGGGRKQIFGIFALESLMLGLVALVAGPLLGLWLVQVIGASNGFLEFVNRKALPIDLDDKVLVYAVIALALILLTMLLPYLMQTRRSIVDQKRHKSRQTKLPFWQRAFIDVILMAISGYAYYQLNRQLEAQQSSRSGQSGVDYLLFLASTIFILGTGLLFVRLYPYLVRLVYRAGRRIWPPSLYVSFHQISRSDGQEQFLIIFLVLALATGIFNANAARTINQNTEDVISCEIGADIALQAYWQPYDQNGNPIATSNSPTDLMAGMTSTGEKITKYYEPVFSVYAELPGVEHAARVLRKDDIRLSYGGNQLDNIQLMAIDPYDFAQTAWWRNDLNNYHMNEYMNVMTSMPNAVILSSNLKEKLDVEVGDSVVYVISSSEAVEGIVIAFIDYWPAYQPLKVTANDIVLENHLIIGSLNNLLSKTAISPYEVWLKREAGATDSQIYQGLQDASIMVSSIESSNQAITEAKQDSQLQGTNGALTLGFIVSMLVCAIGFLIYWIMSIKSRVLQFGVFRAMGLGRRPLLAMLVCDQVLVSGVAIAFGTLLGVLSSLLYVPLFRLVYRSEAQQIPFKIITESSDLQKILVILIIVLLICFAILSRLVLAIRMDQAVKLGEE